jgi:hypothetical protein
MKKGKGVFALGVLMMGTVIVAPGVSSASVSIPVNLGFEAGLTGWSDVPYDGSATAVESYAPDNSPGFSVNFSPVDGAKFLLLDNASSGQGVMVSQTFILDEGAVLSGSYAFYAPTPTFDFAAVTITRKGSTPEMLSSANFFTNMYYGQGWNNWMWTAEEKSTYTLSYVLQNLPLFGNAQSYAMFDGPSVLTTNVAPVPIPGAALLLGSGLMGMFGVGSRKNRKRLG